jgi:UDP-3-O-[3-hydroxymyristoyl] glucosamine N-acyltransferase
VIVSPAFESQAILGRAAIVTDDPYLYFARLTRLWKQIHQPVQAHRIHPTAVIDPDAWVAEDAVIGPLCVVERGAKLGSGSVLKSRVTLSEGCSVGERCILHSGVVVGADGFGFASHQGQWEKIEQLGAVRIGDDVEIGANTCIDRGAFDDTVIGENTKIDNLVMIAHNCVIGRNCLIAGHVGISGSVTVGDGVIFGGKAGIGDHIRIGEGARVAAGAGVLADIPAGETWSGYPAKPLRQFLRETVWLAKQASGKART